ncbi:Succinyl-CoA--L-malate CoA-transferase beta subunit [Bradyrhizobium ivorense]|uniref:Succinyl-CoA--L-malate CoA-transferase beta subunit n=1 Tax=Bradyrhizobium ivorense TaxID=2511166 RepID=A0A508T205_9BRAD|nr:CoA transferase [Bradyrhizobium ivorense]VIO68500.1 Succinyl-CoA--L-malate CoA-transferase beta subunit [Bradyrhizobium ivorense]
MAGPLQGIRVLDLTTVVMGPYACQLMGDYGAEVIKVESPDGDVMRLSGPMKSPGMGHLFMSTNRSKRSVVIDLKAAEGRDLLLRLAKQADVLLYNIRPQAMARLGLGYEDLRAANPRLVYVGAFGFSQRGPYGARPAYDDLIQGMSGIPWLSLQAGAAEPRYAPVILADRIVGLQVAFATMAAIRHRDISNEGQRVDVPMFENLLTIVLGEHLAGSLFEPPIGESGYQRSLAHNRRPHRTLDGYVCTLVYTDKHWRSFFAAIGQPEMFEKDARFSSQNERLTHINEVYGYLADVLATRTTANWIETLTEADIPVARMNSIDEILGDEHLHAIDFFRTFAHPSEGPIKDMAIPTEWSTSQPEVSRHAPRLGEHTVEVLAEAGLDARTITELLKKKVVRSAKDRFVGKEDHD